MKIKKYDHNTFSDMTKQTMGHSVHPPSLISVLGGRKKKAGWMRTEQISLVLSLNVSN